jgi:hypothetical protein
MVPGGAKKPNRRVIHAVAIPSRAERLVIEAQAVLKDYSRGGMRPEHCIDALIGVLDGWDGVDIAMQFAPETLEYVGPDAEEAENRR